MDFGLLNNAVTAVFGEPITILLDDGNRVVTGIYDSRYYAVEEGEQGASSLITTVALKAADAEGVLVDGRLIARGITYSIADRRPDGQGMVVLELDRT
jgi:hypothetical protein